MADELTPETALRLELALLRGAQAPLVFFEGVTTQGVAGGIGNITVECRIHVLSDGQIGSRSTATGHLRFPVEAIPSIRAALDYIERKHAELSKPPPDAMKN